MLTIPIQVSGDVWNNRSDVKQLLDQTVSGQQIMLDLCSEGPSLRRLGVTELVDQYNLNVSITRWSNGVESVPYQRVFCNANSHFFPMSHHYWVDETPNKASAEFRFAMFQGRGCPSRNRILYDAYHVWPGKFLLSKMHSRHAKSWIDTSKNTSISLESLSEWFTDVDAAQQWFENCPINSIDNRVIQDQYQIPEVSSGEMARSLLLNHYRRFNVELVCETYTRGKCFFPTEKTIRPMVGNRLLLVYGPIDYLRNLQNAGFRTFDTLWDESYDQYEGPIRWKKMSELIDNLASMPAPQWQNIVEKSLEITQHNRNKIRQIIRDLKGI